MNFLIYAEDFYQEYKRGIANYGFNLISALKSNKHNVYIYSRAERDLNKKQYQCLSNRLAFSNELFKEILYFGRYNLKIKKNKKFKEIIKRIYFNIFAIFFSNTLIKYECINLHFESIENYPIWDGFYNDKFFRFKAFYSKKFKKPVKFKVPNSIDYVVSISPQNIKVIGAPLISIFHDALPITSPHHLEEDSRSAILRYSSAIKNSSKILHVSKTTKKEIDYIFSKQLSKQVDLFSRELGQAIISKKDIKDFYKRMNNYEQTSFFLKKEKLPIGDFIESDLNIPYVVNIGAIEPRKNQIKLLNHLLPLIRKRQIRLVFIGKSAEEELYKKFKNIIANISELENFSQKRSIDKQRDFFIEKEMLKDKTSTEELNPYKTILLMENLNNNEVNYVLQGALCLIQYSSSEGFGIPLVEASKNNCPVLASDIKIFEEVGNFIKLDQSNPKCVLNEVIKLSKKDILSRKKLIINQFESVKKHSHQEVNNRLIKFCEE